MRLGSSDGARVELRLLRYEFPDRAAAGRGRDWDANWLVVRGDIRCADGREWSFEHPCLTTWEAGLLGRWLHEVVAGAVALNPFDGGEDEPLVVFTEPNLALSLAAADQETVNIRVHLSLEALPPWLAHADGTELFEFFVVVGLSRANLARAAQDWERELAMFPER